MDEANFTRIQTMYATRVAGHDKELPGYAVAWAELSSALLAHGGVLVCPPMSPEWGLDKILTRSDTWSLVAALWEGESNGCHLNVSELWLDGDVESIATGYALSDDGLWRQHSWGLLADGSLIETTEERVIYVGYVLTDVEALRFAYSNAYPEDVEAAIAEGGRLAEIALKHPDWQKGES